MAHGQANAEILSGGGAPTLTLLHEQPIVCVSGDNGAGGGSSSETFPLPSRLHRGRQRQGRDGRGSLRDVEGGRGSSDGGLLLSNGKSVIGTLCARDFKSVGNQFLAEGKVICQMVVRGTGGGSHE